MKILLTGGAGYIGSACLRWLLKHGHDPIAFDNMDEGNAAAVPEGRLVVGDICDTDHADPDLEGARDRGGDALRGPGVGPALDLRPGELLAGQHGRDQERPGLDEGGGRLEDRLQQHGGDLRLRRRDADPRDHAAGPRDPLRHDQAGRRVDDQGIRPGLRDVVHDLPLLQRLGGRPRRPVRREPARRGAHHPPDPAGRRRPPRQAEDLRRRLGHPRRDLRPRLRPHRRPGPGAPTRRRGPGAGRGPGLQPRLGHRDHDPRSPPGLREGRRPADPPRDRRPTPRRPRHPDRHAREGHQGTRLVAPISRHRRRSSRPPGDGTSRTPTATRPGRRVR